MNLDLAHATIEGGLGGWINTTRLIAPMTRGVAIKDFYWHKNDKGKWDVRWAPMGEGMVNTVQFLQMMKTAGFTGPLQLHMEYEELGGADGGKRTMTISRAEFVRLANATSSVSAPTYGRQDSRRRATYFGTIPALAPRGKYSKVVLVFPR